LFYKNTFCRGFTPNPTSFFVLLQRTKQEKARQNPARRAKLLHWQAGIPPRPAGSPGISNKGDRSNCPTEIHLKNKIIVPPIPAKSHFMGPL